VGLRTSPLRRCLRPSLGLLTDHSSLPQHNTNQEFTMRGTLALCILTLSSAVWAAQPSTTPNKPALETKQKIDIGTVDISGYNDDPTLVNIFDDNADQDPNLLWIKDATPLVHATLDREKIEFTNGDL
jgi:hypothetical protein